MRLSSMFFALLLAPLMLAAQSATGNSSPSQTEARESDTAAALTLLHNRQAALRNQLAALELRNASACPVGFSINRKPDAAVIWTNSPNPRAPHGQGLDITFAKPKSQIASADIVVHGYPAGLHIFPATPSAPSEITETFHLTANADQPLLQPSIWTAHMVAISWVELTGLDYVDGTSWQASTPRQCRAAPSLYVLVDSAR
jgi:hypothetical protein